ncbi:MAG: class B sortase [Clostridia bacterium]|nr:class B sortase [Clostridia bacterium]
MKQKSRHSKKINNKFKRIILLLFIVVFVLGIGYIVHYFYSSNKNKKDNTDILNNVVIDKTEITEQKTERILQLEELKKENEDIVGWIQINDTNIDYPVLQTTDNDFYMKHNYKKESSKDGSIFLDKSYNWDIPSSNLLLYGHNNKNGTMFQDLMNYKEEDFYNNHKTIRFTTLNEDSTYEVMSVFYSRVYYKNEQNVFRYYYFVNSENETDYNDFVENCKNSSIYDTGVTANYGDQLLTLSTCEYSQEDGRFVVVAKKVK